MERNPNPTNWFKITKTDEGIINSKSCTCSGTFNSHMYGTDCLPQLPAVGGGQWEELQRCSFEDLHKSLLKCPNSHQVLQQIDNK
jgi:hypothetical protein